MTTNRVPGFSEGYRLGQAFADMMFSNRGMVIAHRIPGRRRYSCEAIKGRPEVCARIEELRAEERRRYDLADKARGHIEGKLSPHDIIGTVSGIAPEDCIIVTDVGQHQMWTAQMYPLRKPRTFLTSGGLGTMGYGMGAAIGASAATGRRTVLFTGDGSFGMDLNELATAVAQGTPLTVVVFNNGVLGMV